MKNKLLHLIINNDIDFNRYLFQRPNKLNPSKKELLLIFRKDRFNRMKRESKYYIQLERQKRLFENGSNMSNTHLKLLKRFKEEIKNKKLSFIDKIILKEIIEIMNKRLDNEDKLLLGRLESFRNLRKELNL